MVYVGKNEKMIIVLISLTKFRINMIGIKNKE